MYFSDTKPSSLTLLLRCLLLIAASLAAASDDYTTLIFKGCANQKFPDAVASDNLKSLISALLSQSSLKSFYNATAGDGDTAVTGLYQCRGDLSADQCAACVSKAPAMASKICGDAVAARVQLAGCCLRYEIAGFRQVPDTELLFKVCGSKKAADGGGGDFDEVRDAALDTVATGVGNGGGGEGGFYTGSYRNVYVLGQCEGSLGSGDCVECVKSGVEKVKTECGESFSGQVYLQKCYISYNYYPDGAPVVNSSASVVPTPESKPGNDKTQRTVAVVVGGVAALGFGIVCMLCARSAFKKRDVKYDGRY